MLSIRTILHPTDFSERAEAAFRLAAALARDYHAHLIVLHVQPLPVIGFGQGVVPPFPEGEDEALSTQLSDYVAKEDKTDDIEEMMVQGEPGAMILQCAREKKCDLIVMGTHGLTGLGRMLMGSVAEQVVRSADCPVLTVRAPYTLTETVPVEIPALEAQDVGGY